MVDYAKRLAKITAKKAQLELAEQQLLERRKKVIGNFAERLGLLTQSDELIYGLFMEAQKAIDEKSEKIKAWELAGKEHGKQKVVEETES